MDVRRCMSTPGPAPDFAGSRTQKMDHKNKEALGFDWANPGPTCQPSKSQAHSGTLRLAGKLSTFCVLDLSENGLPISRNQKNMFAFSFSWCQEGQLDHSVTFSTCESAQSARIVKFNQKQTPQCPVIIIHSHHFLVQRDHVADS